MHSCNRACHQSKGAAVPDETAFDAASLVTSAETAAGFWQMGILWTLLVR